MKSEYNSRNRLKREYRVDSGATGVAPVNYDLSYTYDAGGPGAPGLVKQDNLSGQTTTYTYDVHTDDEIDGGQHNNRLLSYEVTEPAQGGGVTVVEQRWYEYGPIGEVHRVIRRITGGGDDEIFTLWHNGRGHVWQASFTTGNYDPQTGEVANEYPHSAAQYRYDSGRQRYHVLTLVPDWDPDPNPNERGDWITESNGQWTEYLGENAHADLGVDNATGAVTTLRNYLQGVGFDAPNGVPHYVHADQVGTTRRITDSGHGTPPATIGWVMQRDFFTAFGEPVDEASDPLSTIGERRYGYVGAWGYEEPISPDPLAMLGWLHVGERYYDPSSGRFTDRDPIGIQGGSNTYVYLTNRPSDGADPSGLDRWYGDDEGIHQYIVLGPCLGSYWRVDFSAAGLDPNGYNWRIVFSVLSHFWGQAGSLVLSNVPRPIGPPDIGSTPDQDYQALIWAANNCKYYNPAVRNCRTFSNEVMNAGLTPQAPPPPPIGSWMEPIARRGLLRAG